MFLTRQKKMKFITYGPEILPKGVKYKQTNLQKILESQGKKMKIYFEKTEGGGQKRPPHP